jgi:hypothetical protein
MRLQLVEPTPRRVTGAGQCLARTNETEITGAKKEAKKRLCWYDGRGQAKKETFLPGKVFFLACPPCFWRDLSFNA